MMKRLLIVVFALISLVLVEVTAGCRDTTKPPENKTTIYIASTAEPGFADSWDRSTFDHGLWDQVLQRFVDDYGLVDYAGIERSKAFAEYLHRLSETAPNDLKDDKERLAFWINAYNAFMIRALLEVLPVDQTLWSQFGVQEVKIGSLSIWKGVSFSIGGRIRTLDEIENEILRKKAGLRDPRIHVSLVCGALGCPPLWQHAYSGREIDAQLQAALQRFVGNPHQCMIQVDRGVIQISKVFRWYRDDFMNPAFSPNAESIPAFLALAIEDTAIVRALKTSQWRLEYLDYDWTINMNR